MPFFCAEKTEGEENEASECFTKESIGVEGECRGINHNAQLLISTLGQAA